MDDIKIITAFCIIEDTLMHLGHKSHYHAQVTDAEVLLVAVVSSMYFHNHHERALFVMKGLRYLTKPLSISRFSRRLHSLAQRLEQLMELIGQLFAQGEVFIIDSMPIPMCQYARAGRCKKVNAITHPLGKAYFGKCIAKKWRFYGWRLHLVCRQDRVPVAFQLLPASWHDLTPIYELTSSLPEGASVYADKAYVSGPVKEELLTKVEEMPSNTTCVISESQHEREHTGGEVVAEEVQGEDRNSEQPVGEDGHTKASCSYQPRVINQGVVFPPGSCLYQPLSLLLLLLAIRV